MNESPIYYPESPRQSDPPRRFAAIRITGRSGKPSHQFVAGVERTEDEAADKARLRVILAESVYSAIESDQWP